MKTFVLLFLCAIFSASSSPAAGSKPLLTCDSFNVTYFWYHLSIFKLQGGDFAIVGTVRDQREGSGDSAYPLSRFWQIAQNESSNEALVLVWDEKPVFQNDKPRWGSLRIYKNRNDVFEGALLVPGEVGTPDRPHILGCRDTN